MKVINKQVIAAAGEGCNFYRIPGIITTSSGSIILYCEFRKDSCSDWASMDVVMKKSTDGGDSWSDWKTLVCGDGKTVGNPIMFSGSDRIVFMWQENYCRVFTMESFDDGRSWSEPVEHTGEARRDDYDWTVFACGPGHGTVLSSGRYITPVWMALDHANPKAHRPSQATVMFSDDCGKSWSTGEWFGQELKNPSETALAELPDGTIVLNVRHENELRRRYIATGKGAGPWKGHFADELPDPICMGSMIADGERLLFVNCCNGETRDRKDTTLYESLDGGKSWRKLLKIDDIGGYSDLTLNAKGELLVFYEETVTGIGITSLNLAKIAEL